MSRHLERAALIEALWTWDPIGVAAFRSEAEGEYDHLATELMAIIQSGGGPTEVEAAALGFVADLGLQPLGVGEFMSWIRHALA